MGRSRKTKVPTLLPPSMSDEDELALALVLWKSLRVHTAFGGPGNHPTAESEAHGETAIRLAKKIGVSEQFFAMLFRLNLVTVALKPIE